MQTFSRSGSKSVITVSVAPIALAVIRLNIPIGPAPQMSTDYIKLLKVMCIHIQLDSFYQVLFLDLKFDAISK